VSFNTIITKTKNLFRFSSCYEIKDRYGWYSPAVIYPTIDKQIFKTYYWEGFSILLHGIIKRTRASGLMGTGALRLFRIDWTKRYRDNAIALPSKDHSASLPASSVAVETKAEQPKWTGDRAPDPIVRIEPKSIIEPAPSETERCIGGSNEYFGWLNGSDLGLNNFDFTVPYPINPEEGNIVSAPTGIH
jgi:hypothetical protein